MGICSNDELVELSILRGQEIDELVESGFLNPDRRFDEDVLESIELSYPEVIILIKTGSNYPAEQLDCEMSNLALPRLTMDALRIDIRKIVEKGITSNNYEKWKERENEDAFGVFGFEMTALHIARKTAEHLEAYRGPSASEPETDELGKKFKNAMISEKGMDISSIQGDATASSVLGKLPEEICDLIPQQFRILHVESVLRQDLHSKFLACQKKIREDLRTKSKGSLAKCIPQDIRLRRKETLEGYVDYLATPRLTFHGTSNRFVPSIVRYGFLKPGDLNPATKERLPVRCGSTYGRGVYSSPSAEFSLSYSGSEAQPTSPEGFWGMKLFVCATLMGLSADMTRGDNWRERSEPYPGAHSHVSNNKYEYIVFDSAQILPCYVIHLDWGKDNEEFFKEVSQDSSKFVTKLSLSVIDVRKEEREMAPGDRQRKKEELVAKAKKYFPYGYGPATGMGFVVEDVGEVYDDEEEYGEYQKDRVDATNEESDFWKWGEKEEGEEKRLRLDEYRDSRFNRGKGDKRKKES